MATKFTPHKGSWGDRYIIESDKDSMSRKRVSCSDCAYFQCDKSCIRKNIYVPAVGYNNWRYCKSFLLSDESSDNGDKVFQVLKIHGSNHVRKKAIKNLEAEAERVGKGHLSYWDLDDERRALFYDCYNKNGDAIMRCAYMVPLELFEGYKRLLETDECDLYDDALAVFLKRIGIAPGRKGVRRLRRESIKKMPILLFSGQFVGFNEITFSKLFVTFFAEHLKEKRVFENWSHKRR